MHHFVHTAFPFLSWDTDGVLDPPIELLIKQTFNRLKHAWCDEHHSGGFWKRRFSPKASTAAGRLVVAKRGPGGPSLTRFLPRTNMLHSPLKQGQGVVCQNDSLCQGVMEWTILLPPPPSVLFIMFSSDGFMLSPPSLPPQLGPTASHSPCFCLWSALQVSGIIFPRLLSFPVGTSERRSPLRHLRGNAGSVTDMELCTTAPSLDLSSHRLLNMTANMASNSGWR